MDLNKENLKRIRGLIVFTILVFVALWNYKTLYRGVQFLGHVIFPFALGGGIAFVLNVPMRFLEEKLFQNTKYGQTKWGQKLARPVSLILAVLFVVAIIGIVMFVVIPELGNTILNIGKTLQEIIPKLQAWAVKMLDDNVELATYIQGLEFEWDKILGNFVNFLKNGAGSVLDATFAAAKSIVSGMYTFFIAFVFGFNTGMTLEEYYVEKR